MSTDTDDPDEPTPPPGETALKITKYEAGTTVTLAGATFEVVGPDGDTIVIYTTPESGSITIPLTEVGNYTIYERVPPEYHLLDEEPVKQITVKYGEVAKVAFENEPYGDLRMSLAAAAAGADGLIIEVHNDPPHAKCDGQQSLTPAQFDILMRKMGVLVDLMGKKLIK